MKIVGIISMQRIYNYGSFLQAYALKRMIEKSGNKVIFLDYKVEKPRNISEASFMNKRMKQKIRLFIYKILNIFHALNEEQQHILAFRKMYDKNLYERLGVSKKCRKPVDTLVIGSDEVFNCLQSNINVGFSKELFGIGFEYKKKISYAASFGNTTIEKIDKEKVTTYIKKWLRDFDSISVRDDNSLKICKELQVPNVCKNLDPVLMYDFKNEIIDQKTFIKEPYMIVYAYANRINENEKNIIISYAKKNNLALVSVGGYQKFCDYNIVLSPLEVLGLFKNCSCVVTDTFHGSILSIINKKKFAVIVRTSKTGNYGNSEKIDDLLRTLKLTDQVANYKNIEEILKKEINYDLVDTIIEKERKKARDYLEYNL